ncbi:uncharacterized protein PG986_011185 [Apiospora aurea]|uniref:Uncharacterized protein n=1 Tax=Apiospora aurea TaxID=335848 RepID=A0ABR1Q4B6_9PEZI
MNAAAADGIPDSASNDNTNGNAEGVTDEDASAAGDSWVVDFSLESLESEAVKEGDADEAVGSGSDWEDAPLYVQLQLQERLRRRYQRDEQQ